MANRRTVSAPRKRLGWRGPIVYALVLLGLFSLLGFSMAHWAERQILTTDNWVEMVGPLPQNPTVNSALSSYAVDKLFTGVNVEQQISNVLPPQADFLSSYLSTQLKTFLTKVASNIIGSNQFHTIWVAANKTAHQKLVTLARQNPPPSSSQKATNFSLKLSSLQSKIDSVLGQHDINLLGSNTPTANTSVSLVANLKTSFATFRKIVQTTDFLNGTLGLLALVLLVGAIVLAKSRRRVLLVIAIGVLVIGLSELIAIKAVRPEILNQVQNGAYRPAVGYIYDTLLASFRNAATTTVIVGVVLWVLAFVLKRSYINKVKFLAKLLKRAEKTKVWKQVKMVRDLTRKYIWQTCGVAALVTLAILAFVTHSNAQDLLRALMILILVEECINLFATRRMPMKQA